MRVATFAQFRCVKVTKTGKERFDAKATLQKIKNRLEYLRGEIEAERISYGEIAELQELAGYIEPGDSLLMQWAGVPEE